MKTRRSLFKSFVACIAASSMEVFGSPIEEFGIDESSEWVARPFYTKETIHPPQLTEEERLARVYRDATYDPTYGRKYPTWVWNGEKWVSNEIKTTES